MSYLSSAVGDIFRAGVADAVRNGTEERLMKEVTIGLKDVREIGSELIERSGELLASSDRLASGIWRSLRPHSETTSGYTTSR